MSGTKYNKYYTPLCGEVLVLPYPDKPLSAFLTGKLDEVGVVISVDEPILDPIQKGVVVEKGKENPYETSQVKRRDVVIFPRGCGARIKIATQVSDEEPVEREFIIMKEREIIAIV